MGRSQGHWYCRWLCLMPSRPRRVREILDHRHGTRADPCLNLKRLLRGEHQVPDQADQDQREGSAAQQGRQVLPEDRDPQGP
ncbi:hypothetical protein SGPA1_30520 [Streptomyces misionensis JCM 4497]